MSWTAPTNAGSSPITSYTVTASPGGQAMTVSTVSATFTGLANGTAYTFSVKATNSVGDSVASDPSSATRTPNVPGAPTAVIAAAGSGQSSLQWTAPGGNGDPPVTAYSVAIVPSVPGARVTVSGTKATLLDLTNGSNYTFQVTATNTVGDSSPGVSNSVTPAPAQTSTIVGLDGGTVATPTGVVLTFPPGTIDSNKAITVTEPGLTPPAGYGASTMLYQFGPEGTVFAHPVTVTLPLATGVTTAAVYWSHTLDDGGTTYDNIGGTVDGGSVIAQVVHFSSGFAGTAQATQTVSGSEVATFESSTRPIINVPQDFSSQPVSALVFQDGGYTEYPGVGTDAGTFTVGGVPVGEFMLKARQADGTLFFFQTGLNAVDLGYTRIGRPAQFLRRPAPRSL